jgi:UDP-glucuronate decarboxylase
MVPVCRWMTVDQETTILELAQLIARLSPVAGLQVKHPPASPARQALFRSGGHFDLTKMKNLGWIPCILPEAGFERTLRYFTQS